MPVVSVIVPTKDSGLTLEACLRSAKQQTHPNIELIVVDNQSTDETANIAKRFTEHFFIRGPERSAQRNFGVKQAKGRFVMIIDSDMVLSKDVVSSCVATMNSNPEISGVIIPEESFGEGFWAKCKKLERSFYVGVTWMEAARFFERAKYLEIGGYDEALVSGEDYDLSYRVEKVGKLARIKEYIYHNEGRLSLVSTIRKKIYYADKHSKYMKKASNSDLTKKQTSIISRYALFFSHPAKLFKNPLLGIGMIFMKTCEFSFGAIGYIKGKIAL